MIHWKKNLITVNISKQNTENNESFVLCYAYYGDLDYMHPKMAEICTLHNYANMRLHTSNPGSKYLYLLTYYL